MVVSLGHPGVAASPALLIGDQTVETQADSDGAGTAEAFRTAAVGSGSTSDLFVYLDSTPPAKLVAGIYADNAGHPGALLAQGALAGPKGASWNDVRLGTSVSLEAGAVYWIAVLAPSGTGTVHFRDRKSAGASETSSATTLGTLPTSWKTGKTYRDDALSAYALAAAVADTTPPSQPGSPVVTARSASSVSVSWAASTDDVGVAGYDVFVDSQKAATVAGTSYTVSGLSCGQSVSVGVVAFDAAGNRSSQAAVSAAAAACADVTPPTTPGGFGATSVSASSISTSWSQSTDDVGVVGYRLSLNAATVATTTSTAFTFTGLACATSYTLGVVALDAAGNASSTASTVATTAGCVDTTPPTQPTSLAISAVTTSGFTAAWTASSDDVGVSGYTVYLDGSVVAHTQSTSFPFAGLGCGTTHTVGVEADDAAGNVSPRAVASAATAACPDTAAPSTPTGLFVTSSTADSIAVLWSASTDDVGVAGYRLYLDGAPVATATGTSDTFSGLACASVHTLGVAAYDAAGNQSAIASVTGATGNCPDSTPPTVSLVAPADGASVSGTVSLEASAADDTGVASVTFLVDGRQVGTPVTAPPYTLAWNSSAASNGQHQVSALATDGAGNVATSGAVAIGVDNAFDTSNALKAVVVGPGYTVASAREVVRTADDRVYLFLADDTAQRRGAGPGVIHAYRADQTGIPTSFTEADPAHRPSSTSTHVLFAPDARLDRSGVVHLVYINDANHNVVYQTFSTITDTWGPTETLGTNGATVAASILREGNATLVLDASDDPEVVWSTGSALVYRSRAGGTWSAAATVTSGGTPLHPQLAADAAGTLHLSWLQDGSAPAIDYAAKPAGAAWGQADVVASTDVLSNANDDQGPSIVVDGSGVPYVLYVSAKKIWTNGADYGAVRIRYRTATGWALDSIPTDLLTHTPQIYGQGDDVYAFLGHDTNIAYGYAWQPAGGSWSPYTVLFGGKTVDGAASVRWDPQRETNPSVIDTSFYDEDVNDDKSYLAQAYYMGVLPRGAQPGQSPDATPPTVSLSTPSDGATVSGSVAVTAAASDDVGVVGVQFTLDGKPLGTEDVSAPYSVAWDTTTVSAGTHVLGAIARDAAGNRTSATGVSVAVSNTPPADTTPPTVSLTAPAAGTTVAGTVSVTATAADDVGVAGVQFVLDGNPLGAEDTAAPYAVSWDTTLAANGTHTLGAVARDAAGNRTTAATVTVTVQNTAPDTTPPTVSVTAPASGTTVSGTTSVAGSATDDVGVAGVQFLLDGAALGAEDTTAPYGVSWSTAAAANGSHVLTAVARDAAGNRTTSAPVTVTVSNAQAAMLVGDQSVESSGDSDTAGQAEAFSYVAGASGTVTTLKVYLDSASAATKVVVGLYAAGGSHPGTLLGQGTIAAPAGGAWNTVSVAPVTISAGTTYWLAILAPSGAGTVRFRDRSSGGACETSSQTSLAALPASWSPGTTYKNAPMSAVAG